VTKPRIDFHAKVTEWAARLGRYRMLVLVAGTLLTVGSVFAAMHLRFNTDLADLLPADHPDLKILRRIQARYASDTGFMVLLSKNHVFALEQSGAIRMHNGRTWKRWPARGKLNGLWGLSATRVYAVGQGGLVLAHNGKTWKPMATGDQHTLRAIWGARPDRLTAVGDGGTVLGFDGHRWSRIAVDTSRNLRAVSGAEAQIFAVGDGGTILHQDGTGWRVEPSGVTRTLLGVYAAADGQAFAVGEQGTFLVRDPKAGSWRAVAPPRPVTLRGVFGLGPQDVIAVGDGGVILHFDGQQLVPRPSGTTAGLYAVHGAGRDDVWVAGDDCAIRRRERSSWGDGPLMSYEAFQKTQVGILDNIVGRRPPPACSARFVSLWRPDADMQRVKTFIPRLARLLERDPDISRVAYRKPIKFFKDHALLYADVEDLNQLRDTLEENLERETAKGTGLYIDLEQERTQNSRKQATGLQQKIDRMADEFGFGTGEWYMHPDGTSLGLVVYPARSGSDLEHLRSLQKQIRSIVDSSGYGKVDPLLRVDIAGDGVDKIREYDASVQDIFGLTPYAIGGIILLMLIYFRSGVGLIFVALPLGMSIAWTFAITTLFIGTLNLVTGFLFAVLFGLGIDYGLQLYARYREGRLAGLSMEDAKSHMVLDTGRATLTSALTTTAALLTLTVMDFRGFSEFGFIAGIGVLLAMVSFILVMPALISLAEQLHLIHFKPERARAHAEDTAQRQEPFAWPRLVLVVSVFLLAVGVVAATRVRFEYNTRKLRPPGHEDEVERRSGTSYGRSFTPTLMVADTRDQLRAAIKAVESLRDRRARQHQKRVTGTVFSILNFVPGRQHEKRAILEEIHELLQDRRWNLVREATRQRLKLDELRTMARARPFDLEHLPREVRRSFRGPGFGNVWLAMVSHRVDLGDIRQAALLKSVLGSFQGARYVNLLDLVPRGAKVFTDGDRAEVRCPGGAGQEACVERALRQLRGVADRGRPVFSHVVRAREAYDQKLAVAGGLRGQVLAVLGSSSYLLRVTHGAAVEPSGTFHVSSGEMVLAEVVDLLLKEGRLAFLLAFGTIFIATLLDFRSLKLAGLAGLPLVVGFLWTFGIMNLVGLRLNLFNFVILPALLGIGIDYGVHYVHRYETEGVGNLARVMRALYWVIFFCAATTVVGFGNMALANHPGLRSLGQLAIIGLGCMFFASTYTLPSVLYAIEMLRGQRRALVGEHEDVVIYAVTYCPACRLVRRLLTDRNVPFTYLELDTLGAKERAQVAARLVEKAGTDELPVTQMGDRFIKGFDPAALTTSLEQHRARFGSAPADPG